MEWKSLYRPAWWWRVWRSVFALVSQECQEWYYSVVMAIPGEIGSSIRTTIVPFKRLGSAVKVRRGGWIFNPSEVSIGDNSRLNIGFLINGGGGVEIGSHVRVGPRVIIYSQNHNYEDRALCIDEQGYRRAKTVIEDDVWLCAGAIILPGVTVRKGTVVAAGAVVTKETEPYSIVAGVPAIKIGERQ